MDTVRSTSQKLSIFSTDGCTSSQILEGGLKYVCSQVISLTVISAQSQTSDGHAYDSMTVIDEQVQEPCNEQTIQVLSEEGNLLFTHQLSPQLVIYIS